MSDLSVIGVDPGMTTGICRLDYVATSEGLEPYGDPCLLQVNWHWAEPTVWDLTEDTTGVLVIEQFVVSRRSGYTNSSKAGQITRDLVTLLETLDSPRLQVIKHRAADVKPWASDVRLDAAGIKDLCRGMPHALDAGRHALYAACRYRGVPDPLSSRRKGA